MTIGSVILVASRSSPILFTAVLMLFAFAASVSAQQNSSDKEWNEILAAAKKEGKVVVANSPDSVMREISTRFKARFGITLEHIAGRSGEIVARLRSEQSAGLHTVDIFMPGMDPAAPVLYPEKMLAPLRPLLFLPEVIDPTKWKQGKLWFVDPEGQFVLRVFSHITTLLHINTDQVKLAAIQSAKDLLDPKWKGKIALEDPTTAGSGSNQAARIYAQLGEEFFKRLYLDQKPFITREHRQLSDSLARGTYPITFNAQRSEVERMRKEGFPIKDIMELPDLPGALTGSPWLLTLMKNAPHPHAARVFANWIVSKEGLEIYSRGEGSPTLRTDIEESFLPGEVVPRPGINYFDTYEWQWAVTERQRVKERIKQIMATRSK
jgi:iron(III) transport system substrate-binding protein